MLAAFYLAASAWLYFEVIGKADVDGQSGQLSQAKTRRALDYR